MKLHRNFHHVRALTTFYLHLLHNQQTMRSVKTATPHDHQPIGPDSKHWAAGARSSGTAGTHQMEGAILTNRATTHSTLSSGLSTTIQSSRRHLHAQRLTHCEQARRMLMRWVQRPRHCCGGGYREGSGCTEEGKAQAEEAAAVAQEGDHV